MDNQEIEVKFHVKDLRIIEERIIQGGGILILPRILEVNLRFDTPAGNLSQKGEALRLRKDKVYTLTYKGASHNKQGTRVRTEIQTRVEDFESTKALLEALGYVVNMTYEKYRQEYSWQEAHVSLDEMPFGTFIEVEGKDPVTVHDVCDKLRLNWEKRIPLSYIQIFHKIKSMEGLSGSDCTFEVFQTWKGSLAKLGILPADNC